MKKVAVVLVLLASAIAIAQAVTYCASNVCIGDTSHPVLAGGGVKLGLAVVGQDGGVAAVQSQVNNTPLAVLGSASTGTTLPDVIIGGVNSRDGGQPLVVFRSGQTDVATLSAAGVFTAAQQTNGGPSTALRFISTDNSTGTVNDAGANFLCSSNPATSSPCLADYGDSMEIGGFVHGTPQSDNASIYLGAMLERDGGSLVDILQCYGAPGCSERAMFRFMYDGTFKQSGIHMYLNTASSSSGGRIHSANGGIYLDSAAGEILTWNETAGTVASWYTGGGPTLVGSLSDTGGLDLKTGPSSNSCTLDGGSPAQCDVTTFANAKCVCSPVGTTKTIAAAGCAVSLSGTTLTVTSADTADYVVNVECH